MSKNITRSVLSFGLMLLFWGWLFQSIGFAFAFLVVLFIHEMGHYVVAKYLGMDVSEPIFTPIGALIQLKQMPKNAWEESLMAYGGPLIGTLGAIGALVVGVWTQSPEILMAAKVGFMLNFFNLIPLSPLDGGRISMAISRHFWIIGAPLLAGYLWFSGALTSPFGILMVFLLANWAIDDVRGRSLQAAHTPEYFTVSLGTKALVLAAYLGLGAFLYFALANFATVASWFAF